MTNQHEHLKQLTWLRGIAAFFVISSHTLNASNVTYFEKDIAQSNLILEILNLGTFGVLLFFVLSGCTLYISYSENIASWTDIFSFYIKRFFRIWPAFIISIACYFLFRNLFQNYYPEPMQYWIEPQFLNEIPLSAFLSYPTLTFNFSGHGNLFNNAYWSLPVEFQYYLLFPLILISTRYISTIGPILIGLFFYLLPKIVNISSMIDLKLFLLAYSFCGGVLIAFVYKNYYVGKKIPVLVTSVIAIILIFFVSFVANDQLELPDIIFVSNKWNFYTLSAIFLTIMLLYTKITLPKYLDEVLMFLGNISYSSYLYHNLFIGLAVLIVIKFELSNYKLAIIFSFASLLTYILSYYSYEHIEKTGIRTGKKLSQKLLLRI